jgi:DNA segregation ATPase FtsK/SpoIIIE-like protein
MTTRYLPQDRAAEKLAEQLERARRGLSKEEKRKAEKVITAAGWLESARDLAWLLEKRIEERVPRSIRAEPEELRKALHELSLDALDILRDILKILRGTMEMLGAEER